MESQTDPAYWAEIAKLDFSVTVSDCISDQKTNKTDFAQKVGVSKQYITKILGGNANFTIESMAKIAFALGKKLKISMIPLDSEHGSLMESSSVWGNVSAHQALAPSNCNWQILSGTVVSKKTSTSSIMEESFAA